jgi:hypothetical protein
MGPASHAGSGGAGGGGGTASSGGSTGGSGPDAGVPDAPVVTWMPSLLVPPVVQAESVEAVSAPTIPGPVEASVPGAVDGRLGIGGRGSALIL